MLTTSDLETILGPVEQTGAPAGPVLSAEPALVPGSVTAQTLYQLLSGRGLVHVTAAEYAAEPELVVSICTHLRMRFPLQTAITPGSPEQARSLPAAMPWLYPASTRRGVVRVFGCSAAPKGSRGLDVLVRGPSTRRVSARSLLSGFQALWVGDPGPPPSVIYRYWNRAPWNFDIPLDIILAGAPSEGDGDDR